eukprot:3955617-Amphidinium_carterae.1
MKDESFRRSSRSKRALNLSEFHGLKFSCAQSLLLSNHMYHGMTKELRFRCPLEFHTVHCSEGRGKEALLMCKLDASMPAGQPVALES